MTPTRRLLAAPFALLLGAATAAAPPAGSSIGSAAGSSIGSAAGGSTGPAAGGSMSQPPHGAFGDYLAASVALQSNDDDYAAEHMLRALAADPRNRSLRERAFLAASLVGRPEARLLASGLPGDAAAALVLGNAAALAGHWDEAIRAYGAVPRDGALGDLLRPVLVAWAEFGAGHPDVAITALQPLASGTRLPGFYALQAALVADAAERQADATAFYRTAQADAPGLNLALARILASFEARSGHIDAGQSLIHALVTAVPTLAICESGIDASLTVKPVSTAHEGLARVYLATASLMTAQAQAEPHGGNGGGAGALLMLRFALALDPASSETRLVLSDVEDSMHDRRAARDALAPVRASDPLFALAQLRIAELDDGLGDDASARRIYAELIHAYPGQAEPARELGELLNDAHRYDEAVAPLSEAIADTKNLEAGDWSLFFDRAVAFDRSHQWNRAEADLRHALTLSPDQPYVLNYLGYSYAEQGRNLDEARHMLERALAQKPRDGAFMDSLGWVILKQGQVGAAVDQLQQAAEITPEDPTVNYHLGVAYWAAGRRVEAENQWRRALILKPDPDDLPKIEARLHEADAGRPLP